MKLEILLFGCALFTMATVATTISVTRAYRNKPTYPCLWSLAYLLFQLGLLSFRIFAPYAVGGLGTILLAIWGLLVGIPSLLGTIVLLVRPPKLAGSNGLSNGLVSVGLIALTFGVLYWAYLDYVQSLPHD